MIPCVNYYAINRGSTLGINLTLVSGTGSTPINLSGYNSTFVCGPYLNISSVTPTISGSVSINAAQGQISVTISGSATATIYSPQPFYISLTLPNGNVGVLMNGTINFISPYNTPVLPRPKPLNVGSPDVTIGITDWDNFVPWPQPPPTPPTSSVGSWTPAPNPPTDPGNLNT